MAASHRPAPGEPAPFPLGPLPSDLLKVYCSRMFSAPWGTNVSSVCVFESTSALRALVGRLAQHQAARPAPRAPLFVPSTPSPSLQLLTNTRDSGPCCGALLCGIHQAWWTCRLRFYQMWERRASRWSTYFSVPPTSPSSGLSTSLRWYLLGIAPALTGLVPETCRSHCSAPKNMVPHGAG